MANKQDRPVQPIYSPVAPDGMSPTGGGGLTNPLFPPEGTRGREYQPTSSFAPKVPADRAGGHTPEVDKRSRFRR